MKLNTQNTCKKREHAKLESRSSHIRKIYYLKVPLEYVSDSATEVKEFGTGVCFKKNYI